MEFFNGNFGRDILGFLDLEIIGFGVGIGRAKAGVALCAEIGAFLGAEALDG